MGMMIGWMSLTALLTGAVLFGLLTWTGTAPGLEVSVWADGGRRGGRWAGAVPGAPPPQPAHR